MTKEYTDVILEAMNDKFSQMLECFSVHSKEIADLRTELKEDIALVDAKVMGLAKRVDSVEKNLNDRIDSVEKKLGDEIACVRDEVVAHRDSTELHHLPKKRTLKKAA